MLIKANQEVTGFSGQEKQTEAKTVPCLNIPLGFYLCSTALTCILWLQQETALCIIAYLESIKLENSQQFSITCCVGVFLIMPEQFFKRQPLTYQGETNLDARIMVNMSAHILIDRHRPVLPLLPYNHLQISSKLGLLAQILHPANASLLLPVENQIQMQRECALFSTCGHISCTSYGLKQEAFRI